jgi:hypothetical protein
MSENGQYLLALNIAKAIIDACNNKLEAEQILDLARKVIELRWSIAQKQS